MKEERRGSGPKKAPHVTEVVHGVHPHISSQTSVPRCEDNCSLLVLVLLHQAFMRLAHALTKESAAREGIVATVLLVLGLVDVNP